jgi:hypothetical protein
MAAFLIGDFCNKIGTKRTSRNVYSLSAFEGEADVACENMQEKRRPPIGGRSKFFLGVSIRPR